MTLENQVVSREYAEKMRDLGFPQSSYFWWKAIGSGIEEKDYRISDNWSKDNKHYGDDVDQFSAFTVAELGEMLPDNIKKYEIKETDKRKNEEKYYILSSGRTTEGRFDIIYQDWIGKKIKTLCYFEEDTEADARAKMLIYLAENNLINPKEITL